VERVLKTLPHVQDTLISLYSGWTDGFMAALDSVGGPTDPRQRARESSGTMASVQAARSTHGQTALCGDYRPGFQLRP
jgi:hypothetical protein